MKTSLSVFSFLHGYKSYIVGLAMIVLGFYNGDYQLILEGMGMMALRAGIAKMSQ
jgi:hypothetical protein